MVANLVSQSCSINDLHKRSRAQKVYSKACDDQSLPYTLLGVLGVWRFPGVCHVQTPRYTTGV